MIVQKNDVPFVPKNGTQNGTRHNGTAPSKNGTLCRAVCAVCSVCLCRSVCRSMFFKFDQSDCIRNHA